jgi:hypothetical protein
MSVRKLFIAVAGLSAIAFAAEAAVYWQYPAGTAPNGTDQLGPVHQGNNDVTLSVSQLATGIANVLGLGPPVPVASGGTGSTTALAARSALGLALPLPVASGGTGAPRQRPGRPG